MEGTNKPTKNCSLDARISMLNLYYFLTCWWSLCFPEFYVHYTVQVSNYLQIYYFCIGKWTVKKTSLKAEQLDASVCRNIHIREEWIHLLRIFLQEMWSIAFPIQYSECGGCGVFFVCLFFILVHFSRLSCKESSAVSEREVRHSHERFCLLLGYYSKQTISTNKMYLDKVFILTDQKYKAKGI